MNKISNKISQWIGNLNRLKRFPPIQTKILIYNSLVLSHFNFGILLWGFKCEKVFKLQKQIVRILSLTKYNAQTYAIFKHLKLLKVSDILKLQELKFYYKYKNNKLLHFLQALPFHSNTRTYYLNTCIKHNTHHPIGKHDFAKHWIVNDCPNSILDKIITHSLHGFSEYIKAHFLKAYQDDCTIVDCYVCNNKILVSQNFWSPPMSGIFFYMYFYMYFLTK